MKLSADPESWGRPAEVSRQEELELTDFLGKWKRVCSRTREGFSGFVGFLINTK